MRKFTRREQQEMTYQRSVAACQRSQGAFSDDQDFGIGNRFRRGCMPLAGLPPENAARSTKTADLRAAVAENFIRADSSADDLIKTIRRLILVNDLYSARIVSAAADELHPAIERFLFGPLLGSRF